MAKKVQLLPKAKEDLKNIYRYTKKQWGVVQAENYSQEINDTLLKLARGQLQGQNAGNIREGLKRQISNSHVIFFTTNQSTILVAAVLHKSMDYIRHL